LIGYIWYSAIIWWC